MSTATAALVTGYVRLDSEHRGHADYERLGRDLLSCHSPTVAFLDGMTHPDATVVPTNLADCWLWPIARDAALPPGTPAKDTAAYHTVQHQKTAWLASAAAYTDAEMLVWVYFGVMHIPPITRQAIRDFMRRAAHAKRNRITLASIWRLETGSPIDCSRPNWYVAGGVAIVPRQLADEWHQRVVAEACDYHHYTHAVTWEVNLWARVAQKCPWLFAFYQADHNASLFDGFQP